MLYVSIASYHDDGTNPGNAAAANPHQVIPSYNSNTDRPQIPMAGTASFGSAAFVVLIFAIFYLFRYTNRGRIFLDRIGRPGEFDDEQTLAREEAEAMEQMDDLERGEYLKAKGVFRGGSPLHLLTMAQSSDLV